MKIFAWLRAKTPKESDVLDTPIPNVPSSYVEVSPSEDSESELLEAIENDPAPNTGADRAVRYDLEPLFLTIDYRDANGRLSRRRITTRWLETKPKATYVCAFCNERAAVRTFRLDRMEGVIDEDGVVEDAATFFREAIGDEEGFLVEARPPRKKRSGTTSKASAYTILRRQLKPALVVLCAAARADDELHPEEVDQIMQYTETEAEHLLRETLIAECPELDGFERLGRLVMRMRPTQTELDEALEQLADWTGERLQRLAKALVGVVEADGVILESEDDFIRGFIEWAADLRASTSAN